MRLPEAKIELAASNEESRYTLRAVQINKETKQAIATNGHILAVVPCEMSDEDHTGLISPDSIKQIRAMQKRSKGVPVNVLVNGKATATGTNEKAEFELVVGQFPRVDAVIPKGEGYEGECTIALNADLLLQLAKAIGARNYNGQHIVKLWVKDRSSSVLVKTSENVDAVGVIMPVRA
jgi:DNA polymerase III sliding clamp (beta) subunit (PCNA family)